MYGATEENKKPVLFVNRLIHRGFHPVGETFSNSLRIESNGRPSINRRSVSLFVNRSRIPEQNFPYLNSFFIKNFFYIEGIKTSFWGGGYLLLFLFYFVYRRSIFETLAINFIFRFGLKDFICIKVGFLILFF